MSALPDVTDESCRTALAAFERHAVRTTFDTGRYVMRLATWGQGPPLVIIHGLSDAVRGFAMVMHHLAEHFTCIAYELPNGLDDGAKLGAYRHRDFAADLFALLDHLKLDRVALLGSSFGTTVALAALAAVPQRFTKCVLKGGFAYRPLKWYERLGARQGRYWTGRLCELPFREFAMRRADPATWSGCSPLSCALFLRCNGHTPIRAACRRAVALDTLDLRPVLPTIHTPVLLISGDRDRIVPRAREAVLANHLPDVRRVEFVDCGHYPQYTHPRATADAVANFLGE
ncbi:alpha beta hydrolase : Putative hydrolase or acyltransferase of alpha/beta superfamily OS=Singulisphaera acidiphila (strain ATCC BAA-1392 / DSM 18658 / VKM B-2454 / MOB10) GN=Sinac_1411 PE=4 SV=1: Abhydrolase_6 [Gemmata massiliana]|uniref:AB hydrolase-1 domain-containing protein n=1 Tax=Gemmata massiliana TaxID=1210884 RepID=A0A6P2CWE4_9BACT|nr:alpha/beta hydrolase [Gemmata massiliana]VTR91422.1 alpha beta hydrolase : Putative hydrolase or acyltransferase of alpha/beta superfamily OS=Singulisphaera acidiphila (strain ATCC BAA-1392 / DSM 18658 / VKM B-2454 / MOB10) GN=Sinac_1411 PE=4 SV=1: Abhydrolase_6 [Gemmata massiliana]